MTQQKSKTSLAYARLGKNNNSSKFKPTDLNEIVEFQESPYKPSPKTNTNNFLSSVLGEMNEKDHKYVSGLLKTNIKNRQREDNKNHERTKSYADLLANSAQSRQGRREYSYEKVQEQQEEEQNQKEELQIESVRLDRRPKFFQSQKKNSQERLQARKQKHLSNQQTHFQTPREDNRNKEQNNNFLQFIDEYLEGLSRRKERVVMEQNGKEKKLLRKLESYEKKFKELQLNAHVEMKKMKSRELKLKNQIVQMGDAIASLQEELSHQRYVCDDLKTSLHKFTTELELKSRKSHKKVAPLHKYYNNQNAYYLPNKHIEVQQDDPNDYFDSDKQEVFDHRRSKEKYPIKRNRIEEQEDLNQKKLYRFLKPNMRDQGSNEEESYSDSEKE